VASQCVSDACEGQAASSERQSGDKPSNGAGAADEHAIALESLCVQRIVRPLV
jgi:hypothetical protein